MHTAALCNADHPKSAPNCKGDNTAAAQAASTAGTRSPAAAQQQRGSKLSLASLAAVTRFQGVPALLLMQAGANLAGSLMQSTFSLTLQQRYGLTSKQNGLVLSWVGVCVVIGEGRRVRTVCVSCPDTWCLMGLTWSFKEGCGACRICTGITFVLRQEFSSTTLLLWHAVLWPQCAITCHKLSQHASRCFQYVHSTPVSSHCVMQWRSVRLLSL